jgi:hypothetical protein
VKCRKYETTGFKEEEDHLMPEVQQPVVPGYSLLRELWCAHRASADLFPLRQPAYTGRTVLFFLRGDGGEFKG